MATELEFEQRSQAVPSEASFVSSGASSASSEADAESDWEQRRDQKRSKKNIEALPVIGETPSFAELFG